MKRELSRNKFFRRNPSLEVTVIRGERGWCGQAWRGAQLLAQKTGRTLEAVYWQLSEAVLKLNAREVATAQGWRDARTGQIDPLQTHHIQPRSKGRLDEPRNLEGISQSTHGLEHEG